MYKFQVLFQFLSSVILLLIVTSGIMVWEVPHANALAHNANVAYVTDVSCGSGGVEDSNSSGCSIFRNAITGTALTNGT